MSMNSPTAAHTEPTKREFAVGTKALAVPQCDAVVEYVRRALLDVGGVDKGARILDFGCGHGLHVQAYQRAGFDAFGCDVDPYWPNDLEGRLKAIERPYRIPYEDAHFDAVVSTSVLEHAQNTAELFREIRRVLKPGGVSLHIFPTRWYLPSEPHIHVPLANVFWPHTPRWWLALWALLGVRNEFQHDLPWREVVSRNEHYCRTGLKYANCAEYERISLEVYGNFSWPMWHMIAHGQGSYAALTRRLPFQRLWGWLGRHTRTALLINRAPA